MSRSRVFIQLIGCMMLGVTLIGCATAPAGKSVDLVVGTGGTGGSYYGYGAAMARVLADQKPGVKLTVQTTGGAVENIRLLLQKKIDVGMAAADVIMEASQGSDRFPEKADLKILFAMSPSVAALVTLEDSSIKSYEDCRGKKVAVGPPGSGTEVKAKRILDIYGLTYGDLKAEFLSFSEAVEALKNRNIDATFVDAFSPVPSLMELATTHRIRIVAVKDEMLNTLVSKFPYHSKVTIPAGTYRGVENDVATFGTWCHVLVRPDFSADLAYDLTKTIIDNREQMESIVKFAEYTTLQNATSSLVIDLHPGAQKYFKEKGIIK